MKQKFIKIISSTDDAAALQRYIDAWIAAESPIIESVNTASNNYEHWVAITYLKVSE